MPHQTVVPVFPTRSLKDALSFYTALGFEILAEQHAPYVYGSVKYQDIQIDFYGSKAFEAGQESGHICLVLTDDVDTLHGSFAAAIKQHYGKQLRSGIPRMGTVNSNVQDRRFNMLDPDGNRLIVIEPGREQKARPRRATPLLKAVNRARLDAYSRDEPRLAADGLDEALAQQADEPAVTRFRAFVLRADIAAQLDDEATRAKYVQAAQAIELSEADRPEADEEIARLNDLLLL